MFKFIENSDILMAKTDAVVNTVNCVGVMGKGIALKFKEHFYENFKLYKKACDNGEVIIGKMFVYKTNLEYPKFIINFPTKQHWRENSRYEYIREGLKDLKKIIQINNIESISIPPLGCGNGGLSFDYVKEMILEYLSNLNIDVHIYVPCQYKEKSCNISEKKYYIKITEKRAIAVMLIHKYIKQKEQMLSDNFINNLECQKLFYFLQNSGYDMNLKFEKYFYGPYSNQLCYFLNAINDIFIFNYKNDKKPYSSEIRINSKNFDKIENFIKSNNIDYENILKNELDLLNGFCDSYDMELLSSVHYLVKYEQCNTLEQVIEKLFQWNEHKKKKFNNEISNNKEHIKLAFDRIKTFILKTKNI